MITFSSHERLALLLSILGDEVASAAFQKMNPTLAIDVKRIYEEFKDDPPSEEEVDYIVGDFFKFFHFALEAMGPELLAEKTKNNQKGAYKPAEKKPEIIYFPKLIPGDNPIDDLNRLDPFQIFAAIESDHPKTIALVLRNIDTKQAANVLELFPASTRSQTLSYIAQECSVPQPLVSRVLNSAVQKACSIEFRIPEVDQSKAIADLLRSVNKKVRAELLAHLLKTNVDLAEKVKAKLYIFEDILRLEDRDVQKLLSQVDSDVLIVGLQRCEQELADKLLNNLSKRARDSITEEMEFKVGVSDEEVEEARANIVKTLSNLDESGEIKL
ncbi:MAG TPA: FliG C-terminal domain-containing protein [Pirellulaceae bacterium]|nr:FliG C-terminal domain-containing protein [Pirellulaceae bacterium]HMO92875.1 FliG C-terminal domain-containing protein [Pirellulaceae bacterium]HMP71092.1 FliG C-terminal domain-containing protein [Pirellulaceae bacterium]